MGNGLKLAVALSSALALSGPTMGCDSHEDTELKKLGESTEKLGESAEKNDIAITDLRKAVLSMIKENRELKEKLLKCNRDFTDASVRSAKMISDLVSGKHEIGK